MFFCFFMILARNIKYIHAKYMTKEEDIYGTHWLKKPPSHGLSRAYNGHPCPLESPLIGLASLGHGRMLSEARDGSDGRRNLRAGRPARELNVLRASAMAAPAAGRPAAGHMAICIVGTSHTRHREADHNQGSLRPRWSSFVWASAPPSPAWRALAVASSPPKRYLSELCRPS